MTRLVYTNTFRLAALYLALFAASVLSLLLFIYFSTADFVERQSEETIEAEITGLREQYDQHGLSGLVEIIRGRSAAQRNNGSLYLITDAALNPIAGNLDGWPEARNLRPGWITFPVLLERPNGTKEESTALASVFVLGGSFHLLVGRDLSDATAFRWRVARTMLWAALLTLAMGVGGGLVMTRNMLRRVDAVNRTSERIIHGDLSQRVPLTGSGDEFDQLATNLNAMLDRIERLMLGMRQVTDNIAHDLRTPLARLRARLEVTLLERPDAQRYAEALNQTIAEADGLLGTFNALLSIAEAEAGSRRDTLAVVDLGEIARSVAELYEPVADEKGLTLAVAVDDEALPVNGDRHLLSQAIANLLDNALKYTPRGNVALSAHRQGDVVRIEVADTGPGVPEDRREAVFDRFVRLEGSRGTPGNGLGLSLVRAVARLHGGEIRLEDNRPGLKAVLTLPTAERRAPPPSRSAA
ncbi:MAG TPA: HAMP domain-containing sensor histidine kinase [Stellaceae bacterium]|nr:HAMP domain-containing sensor histidine kinase [Stellaceae bacterium]